MGGSGSDGAAVAETRSRDPITGEISEFGGLYAPPGHPESDQWPIYPVRGVGRTFAHIEHARWATFLDYAGIDWAYQPALLGVTVDMVLKPAFRLGCGMWLHLCSRVPNNSTRIASLIVSRDTGSAVGIICGEMFAPHPERSPVSPLMLFMPDAGITLERYWGGRHRCISPRSPDTQYHDIFSSDVRRAFSLAIDAKFAPL